jgi:hypothetical protein
MATYLLKVAEITMERRDLHGRCQSLCRNRDTKRRSAVTRARQLETVDSDKLAF